MTVKVFSVVFTVIKLTLLFSRFGGGGEVDSSQQYSIEVLVVVDQTAYEQRRNSVDVLQLAAKQTGHYVNRWYATVKGATSSVHARNTEAAIKDYVHAVFAGVNVVLSSLRDYGINLVVRIRSIILTKSTMRTRAKNDVVQGKEILSDFKEWLSRFNYRSFDHALLFTGLTVANGEDLNAEGIAYVARMCSEASLSVVECKPNQNAVLTVAHELGHSLNASHDGDKNNCTSNSSYVMSAVRSGVSLSRWLFSPCSAASIKQLMEKIIDENDCLSPRMTSVQPVRSVYLGQLYDADRLCQLSLGSNSCVCRSVYNKTDDHSQLCQIIWCSMGGRNCTSIVGTDGIACGRKKRCMAGKCVAFQDGPDNVSDTCPMGDSPKPVSGNSTCKDVIQSSPYNCENPYYRKSCCRSCEARYTGKPSCLYGDAWRSCHEYHCMLGFARHCCATCA